MWIGLALSFSNIFFPMASVNEKLFPVEANINEEMVFKRARLGYFLTDYDVENPITRIDAIKEFLRMVKVKKQLERKMELRMAERKKKGIKTFEGDGIGDDEEGSEVYDEDDEIKDEDLLDKIDYDAFNEELAEVQEAD